MLNTHKFLFKVISILVLMPASLSAIAQLGPDKSSVANSADYAAIPALLSNDVDPLMVVDLSVELTQQAESYTGADAVLSGGTQCPGRRMVDAGGITARADICYTGAEEYIGYFDASKCYEYNNSGNLNTAQTATSPHSSASPEYFSPTSSANPDHTCSGANEFSGNFMNWATMTALDQFRSVMTGGARLIDTHGANAQTLLTRAHRYGSWAFVDKAISIAGFSGFTNDPTGVLPGSSISNVRIENDYGDVGNRMRITTVSASGVATTNEYSVVVEVCNASQGLESNCSAYTDGTNTWHKPEGLIIQNALSMRFALFSYLADNSHQRNGGVLRAAAKYIGARRPASGGGFEVNPNAEVDVNGLLVLDPDNLASASLGVSNSGVINYINNFALGSRQYKSFDPVAELYYESLRYLVARDGSTQLSPTPEYYQLNLITGSTDNSMRDNFPVIETWTDPITAECQENFILYTGDQFAWEDHNLPGVAASIYDHGNNGGVASDGVENGGEGVAHQPTSAGIGVDAAALTTSVGSLEGFTNGASNLGLATRGRNNNGWWFAGLSYWANTTDIRSDINGAQIVKTFVVDTQEFNNSPPENENNPLWLAAKYGGFEDANGDGDPGNGTAGASTDEWDADADGVPDTYTLASQPANLVAGLTKVFAEVADRTASASAAAVVANSSDGVGAVYQALYEPIVFDASGNNSTSVEWSGMLYAVFVDEDGNIFEDTCNPANPVAPGNCDKMLTPADARIELRFDDAQEVLLVDRYVAGTLSNSVPIREISSIWNAHEQLSALTTLTSQRAYGATANLGRHIFTWIDTNNNDVVDTGEVSDFVASSFAGAGDRGRYLGLNSGNLSETADLVNYIRGVDGAVSGWRNRTVDADGDGSAEVLRLGDIVHSSPLAVGAPAEDYSARYNDVTYASFRQQYQDRRQVIYVGANDGMLHAFNGGFFDQAANGFVLQNSGTQTAHPLGSELWAYVPKNLQPHLQWLKDNNYPHVYYVDGQPQAFDVNIFPNDSVHPNGWGTILVVGFRLGGGDITIDPNGDTDADLSDDLTYRSAYIVLDITDPESPPTLLAEFSHPELGFTTGEVSIFKNRQASTAGSFVTPSVNDWYLVMGSGPAGTTGNEKDAALDFAESSQNARLFAFNLSSKTLVAGLNPLDTGEAMSFVGGSVATDWNDDFADDALYFGTVGGTVAAPSGGLKRWVPGSGVTDVLSGNSPSQPFANAPITIRDNLNRHWVFSGTGRFFVEGDLSSNQQQTFYGIKESIELNSSSANFGLPTNTPIAKANLEDVTDIRVFVDGSVTDQSGNSPITINTNAVANFDELELALSTDAGWFRDLSTPRNKTIGAAQTFRDFLLYLEYEPSGSSCDLEGDTFLNLVDLSTGTATPQAVLETDSSVIFNSSELILSGSRVGRGFVPGFSVTKNGTVIVTDEFGQIDATKPTFGTTPSGRMSWREIFLN